MIPKETEQTIETVGQVTQIAFFNATDETMPRILVDLSDKMYNQKELAVIREYSTNAADAMVKAGKPISDIQVTFPIIDKLEFKIRDFGSGLTEEDIKNIYCILGKSDKRNSDSYNGMFGYGCKCGFAHADSFMVKSWINGEQSIYQCIKGDSKKLHSVVLLSRFASEEPSGIEIVIPIKQTSMWTFHNVGADFYKHWDVLPTFINFADDSLTKINEWKTLVPTLSGEKWEIRPSGGYGKGVAVMGYVAYPIDWDVLSSNMALTQKTRALFNIIRANNIIFHFNIGDITFVNNREGLEYTESTIDALKLRVDEIFNKIKDSIQAKFSGLDSIWEAKKMYNSIFSSGELELERGEYENETIEKVRILDGNLVMLENTFKGEFSWNGVVLDSPSFNNINRFDNSKTELCDITHNPSQPVMVSYTKKKSRIRMRQCLYGRSNKILVSFNTAIVINDTGKKSGVQQVSRYLIFNANSKIKIVHVLNFNSQEIKDRFFEEYNFGTVPVINMSDIIASAKAWTKANAVVGKNYCNNSGSTVRSIQYFDVANKNNSYGSYSFENIAVRDISDGIFVRVGITKNHIMLPSGNERWVPGAGDIIKRLVSQLGLDIEKVYIVPTQTTKSAWFANAIKSGDWIEFWDLVKDNLEDIGYLELDKANRDDKIIHHDLWSKFDNRIIDPNSPMNQYLNVKKTISSVNINVVKCIIELEMWGEIADKLPVVDRSLVNNEKSILDSYPMLEEYTYKISNGNVSDNVFDRIVEYINAMDVYVKFTDEKKSVTSSEILIDK